MARQAQPEPPTLEDQLASIERQIAEHRQAWLKAVWAVRDPAEASSRVQQELIATANEIFTEDQERHRKAVDDLLQQHYDLSVAAHPAPHL